MKYHNFVSVVVYLHNQESIITQFISQLSKFLQEKFLNYEIIIVDDFSTDCGLERLRESKEILKEAVTIIKLPWYHKPESSMIAGVDLAIGDFVYEIDKPIVNLEFDLLDKMYKKMVEGFDIVSASPIERTSLTSRIFYSIFKKYSLQKLILQTEHMRLVSRRAINRISEQRLFFKYRKINYNLTGLPKASIPYSSLKQRGVELEFGDRLQLAVEILLMYTPFGEQIAINLSISSILISLLLGVYSLVMFFEGIAIPGWTTTMLFLSFGFSAIFALFGILSKHLSMILFEVQKRPVYYPENIERMSTSKKTEDKR